MGCVFMNIIVEPGNNLTGHSKVYEYHFKQGGESHLTFICNVDDQGVKLIY